MSCGAVAKLSFNCKTVCCVKYFFSKTVSFAGKSGGAFTDKIVSGLVWSSLSTVDRRRGSWDIFHDEEV